MCNLKIFTVIFFMFSPFAIAGKIVVHPSNVANFDVKEVERLFLGKSKKFSNGKEAIPIVLSSDSVVQENFNLKILDKSSQQLVAYWAKMIFTGKRQPPKEAASEEDILSLVRENPNTIGIVGDEASINDLKVVLTF